jgi:hypothetical protein
MKRDMWSGKRGETHRKDTKASERRGKERGELLERAREDRKIQVEQHRQKEGVTLQNVSLSPPLPFSILSLSLCFSLSVLCKPGACRSSWEWQWYQPPSAPRLLS